MNIKTTTVLASSQDFKTFSVITFGCRLNQTESEAIAEKFLQAGFREKDKGNGDIVIINSCTVTGKADQKVRHLARRSSDASLCIVTGCSVPENKEKFESISDNVIAIGNEEKHRLLLLPDFLKKNCSADIKKIRGFLSAESKDGNNKFSFFAKEFSKHSRASLKIQDGCDRMCSFCKVCIVRGMPRSLGFDTAVERILQLQDAGYKEITLTGVNLALYSSGGMRLSDLIKMIAPKIAADVRIRFSSLEPDLLDDGFFDILKYDFIAPYFHLPIQSVSSRVLSLTGRKYDEERLQYIIDRLKKEKKDPFIACDIMTGLPAEEDEDFDLTYNFLKKNEFSYLHVFPFSPRKGTRAYTQKHPAERIRDERAFKLRLLSDELYEKYVKRYVGKTVSAVAETEEEGSRFFTSDNYLKIEVKDEKKLIQKGQRADVKLLSYEKKDDELKIFGVLSD